MKNNWFVILIIIVVIVFGGWKLGLFSTVPLNAFSFYQYSDIPTKDYDGYAYSHNPEKAIVSKNVYFVTSYGRLDFKQTEAYFDSVYPGGCRQTVEVYYNNIKIDTLRTFRDTADAKYYTLDGQVSTTQPSSKSSIYAVLEARTAPYSCYNSKNRYDIYFKEPEFLDINIVPLQSSYIEGEDIEVKIDINNRIWSNIKGQLVLNYEVPTIIGIATKQDTVNILLTPGMNHLNYLFNYTGTARNLKITPTFKNLETSTEWIGNLNYDISFYSFRDESGNSDATYITINKTGSSNYFKILGSYSAPTSELLINPKPIFYGYKGIPCLSGYHLNTYGTYCLSDSISELSCVQIGCPSGYEPPYQCTSSGYCAQTIFVDKKCTNDLMCPVDTKCDVPTGLCIQTQIFQEVVQCAVSTDCLVPCEGKVPSCVNRQCSYSGVCISQPPTQTTTKTFWDSLKDIWNSILQWLSSIFS